MLVSKRYDDRRSARFLLVMFLLVVGGLVLLIGFNALFGPNGFLIRSNAVRDPRSPYFHRTRFAGELRQSAPKTLILGNSRAAQYQEEWSLWTLRPVTVIGMGGIEIEELQQLFTYAVEQTPVRRVYLFLDSGIVTRRYRYRVVGDYNIAPYNPDANPFARFVRTRLSPEATTTSVQAVESLWRDAPIGAANHDGNFRAAFATSIQNITSRPDNPPYIPASASLLASIAEQSRRADVELVFVLNPLHVWAMETQFQHEQWNDGERLRRELVQVVANNARRWNAEPYPIWDFATFRGYNAEPVPAAGSSVEMQWFEDPWHIEETYAESIAHQLEDPDRRAWESNGVLLTENNLKAHLVDVRTQHRDWVARHREDVEMIRKALGMINSPYAY